MQTYWQAGKAIYMKYECVEEHEERNDNNNIRGEEKFPDSSLTSNCKTNEKKKRPVSLSILLF